VGEDALARDLRVVKGGFETLSGNRYRTVILPAPTVLSAEARSRLKAFANDGGRVLFLGGTPRLIQGKTIRDAIAVTPADFSWATTVDVKLPATPTPPANPSDAAPAPLAVRGDVLAAVSAAVIEPAVKLDAQDTAIRVMKRRLKDADLYLFFNEGAAASDHAATLFSKGRGVEAWDAQNATVTPIDSLRKNGQLTVHLKLQPYEARVLVVR
jgi:hypothetical protein